MERLIVLAYVEKGRARLWSSYVNKPTTAEAVREAVQRFEMAQSGRNPEQTSSAHAYLALAGTAAIVDGPEVCK